MSEFNDGNQWHVLTNPDAQLLAGRDLYAYRVGSASKAGVMYVDTAFDHHRKVTAGKMRGTLLYQFVWAQIEPEVQANFFCQALGFNLQQQEMVCLDLEVEGGFTVANAKLFATIWLEAVESILQTKSWVYFPGRLSPGLRPSTTGDRIVWAPSYSGTSQRGNPPTWPHDVHQYTDRGFFPGAATSGDTSYTTLTTEAMLTRCNPMGYAEPLHGGPQA